MKKQTLRQSNPYLRESDNIRGAVMDSVISSSAVEGIHVTRDQLQGMVKTRFQQQDALKAVLS